MTWSRSDSVGVAEEVLAAECRLLLPEVRSSRSALEALLHPGFREIGASGRIRSREEIIAELISNTPAPAIESPHVEVVADGVALLT